MRCAAAALLLPEDAAITQRSAAFLHGVDILPRTAPVQVTVNRGTSMPSRPGLDVRRGVLSELDLTRVGGLPVTTLVRTAFDLGRDQNLERAVVGLDAVLHTRFVTADEVAKYADDHPRWPGRNHLLRALRLAHPGSESPWETRTRLLLLRAGLPHPEVQYEVLGPYGEVLARLDLAYPEHRLGIEYDGDHHRERDAFRADLARHNRLRAQGWTVLRFIATDIRDTPERTIAQIRATLRHQHRDATTRATPHQRDAPSNAAPQATRSDRR